MSLKETLKKLSEIKLSAKAKIMIALCLLLIVGIAAYVGYAVFDYTQNNPKFCVSCHLMTPAYEKWEHSAHKNINCHDCHHLTVPEMNTLMYNFIVHRPTDLPDRHGKVIVPWKYCIQCHWQQDKRYPNAPQINKSKIHAKHYFTEQIECSKCHGYKAHEFKPEPRFCTMCHQGKAVHSEGMETLNCLNCHTDKTADLKPDRDKCLFCHGAKDTREQLEKEARLDLRGCVTPEGKSDSKIKIKITKDAPMQFLCYECHHPHQEKRPDWKNCTQCHPKQQQVGKHKAHLDMGLTCNNCHKPHIWTVTPEQAKKDCVSCHEYKNPAQFLK